MGEVDKLQQILKDGAAEYKDAMAKARETKGLMEDNTRLRRKADVISSSQRKSLPKFLPHILPAISAFPSKQLHHQPNLPDCNGEGEICL